MMLKIGKIWLRFGGLSLLLLAACSKEQPKESPSVAVGRKAVYAVLPETEVLAQVNELKLTKGMVEADLKRMIRLQTHRNPKFTAKQMDEFKLKFRQQAPRQFVMEALRQGAAKEAGVTVDEATREKFRQYAFKGFKGPRDKSFADLEAIEGVGAEFLRERIAVEALQETLTAHWVAEEPLKVEDGYAETVRENVRYNNQIAAATNAVAFARATNAWERLKAGEDFVKVGKEMTELEEERNDELEWGTFDEKEFFADEPFLKAALAATKEGEFTPPVAADNGVMIARVEERDPSDSTVMLSRIYFRLAMVCDIPSVAEVIALAEKRHAGEVYKRRINEFKQKSKVSFTYREIDFTPNKGEE